MRRQAKAVNFGVIYGQSPFGLATAVGIEQDEAAKFIDAYFAGYPGIEEFLDQVLAECRENGYVSTILGRRRAIRGVRERRRPPTEPCRTHRGQHGDPRLGGRPDQAGHDRTSIAACGARSWPARMLLQIHDELIFEVPPDELDQLARLVTEEMSGVMRLDVPLKVDVKAGANWADCQERN